MKKPRLITIGLITFLSGLIVVALAENVGAPHEPEYDGKKLTAWLDVLGDESLVNRNTNAEFAIKQMGTNAVPFLVQMLHAKDSRLKLQCMDLLDRQHWVHFRFRDALEMHIEACIGLEILGPDAKAAIPDLADLLSSPDLSRPGGSGGDGIMAAGVLAHIGPNALPALEGALTNSNTWARRNAAIGLGWLGDPSSVSNLLAALKDPDQRTRGAVATALQNIPHQANVIVPALTNYLDDTDSLFVSTVAGTLGSYGADAGPAFPELSKILGSTNYDAAESAALALKEIDFGRALATFTNDLESPDINARRTAACALEDFKSKGESAVPFLVKCLKDPDPGVRSQAATTLWQIGADPDLVVPVFVEALTDSDSQVRWAAATGLGSFGERAKSAVPQIVKLIKETKGDSLRIDQLSRALDNIDPQAAAKLNAK